jgi:hypothetical protein
MYKLIIYFFVKKARNKLLNNYKFLDNQKYFNLNMYFLLKLKNSTVIIKGNTNLFTKIKIVKGNSVPKI